MPNENLIFLYKTKAKKREIFVWTRQNTTTTRRRHDDDTDDDKVRCIMCACVCVHDGPPRRRALLLRKRKTLFSSVSFSSGGGRGFFFAFLPFFFSRESGDLPLVFFAFKTNAFGWWKKKDLPIYPRPRIRALTCHLGCFGRRRS